MLMSSRHEEKLREKPFQRVSNKLNKFLTERLQRSKDSDTERAEDVSDGWKVQWVIHHEGLRLGGLDFQVVEAPKANKVNQEQTAV